VSTTEDVTSGGGEVSTASLQLLAI